jgi:hypothetical protein
VVRDLIRHKHKAVLKRRLEKRYYFKTAIKIPDEYVAEVERSLKDGHDTTHICVFMNL